MYARNVWVETETERRKPDGSQPGVDMRHPCLNRTGSRQQPPESSGDMRWKGSLRVLLRCAGVRIRFKSRCKISATYHGKLATRCMLPVQGRDPHGPPPINITRTPGRSLWREPSLFSRGIRYVVRKWTHTSQSKSRGAGGGGGPNKS